MQKIINVIAIASGVVSLTVVGLGGYVFIRKDAIIENIKQKALGSLGAGGALSGVADMAAPTPPSLPVEVPSF